MDRDRTCFFVSDLHGDPLRYRRLFDVVRAEAPRAVFLGGDLLPGALGAAAAFAAEVFVPGFAGVRAALGAAAPRVFVIPGNDDARADFEELDALGDGTLWEDVHGRRVGFGDLEVAGYACVPPTPFLLKDWERYDVGRHVDPGCVSPEEGRRTVAIEEHEVRWATIRQDLERLAAGGEPSRTVFLFHAPPYDTALDRAALDGRSVEHVPLDVHVGSIAVRRFVEERAPLVTLHGHVHESARLTGEWRVRLGSTWCLSAAHDGPELALVRFDPARAGEAARELLPA